MGICKVIKNEKNNKINGILNQEGKPSELFQQIFNTPTLSLNESIDIYKNIYSDKLKNTIKYQVINDNNISVENNTQEIIDRLKQTGLAENVYQLTTEEINVKLKELGVSEDIRKQVVAYHGSPYSFDRFTTEKMGTGEGAQAFGWGLYFTDLESIARNYAKTLANKKMQIITDGKIINVEKDDLTKAEETAYVTLELDYNIDKAIQRLEYNQTKRPSDNNLEAISILKRTQVIGDRNLYKVSLHKGKTPSEYNWLEWDTQISKEIKEKFSNIIKNESLKGEIHNIKLSNKYDVESFDGGKTWKVGDTTKIGIEEEFVATFKDKKEAEKEAYNLNFVESNITGKDLYESLAKQIGQREASIFLLKNGIDGIKYPAESISRGATSDTARGFNYVVFDENAITIEEQIQFQKALNNIGINLITNGFTYKDKTGKDIVVLNKDTATDETLVHEFSHIFSKWQKENRPKLWKKGQNLVKAELEKGKQKEKLSKKDTKELKKLLDFKIDSVTIYDENTTAEILVEQLSDGEVSLYISEIWSDIKGQGSATKLLNKIQSFSDEYNVAISLRASTNNNIRTSGGLEQDALVKWYKKNSFYISEEDNNFETDETAPFMVYQPTIAVKSEIQEIVDYVKQTQPKLKEGSEAFYDEVLQEFISRESRNMMDEQKQKSPLMQWLSDFWDEIRKSLGLLSMTPEQVANLNLKEFARASVVDLLKGENITLQQAIQRNNGNPLNLAPNGKPSILYQSYKDLGYSEQETERLTAQVYSDSFLDFFGDFINDPQNASKVVDENGQPKLLQHGTKDVFTEFKNRVFGYRGFYFTDKKKVAKTYGDRVMSVFISAKNLVEHDMKGGDYSDNDTFVDDEIENAEYDGNEIVFKNFIDPLDPSDSRRTPISDVFVVFNSNQIKSATENVGTFSTESNDIRYQIIGEKGASRIEEYQQSLNQAKELEKQGEDYSQTGWFKNKQGQWKYFSNEILNEFLDIPQIKNKIVDLKDLLKEDSLLLTTYPELINTKIEFYGGTEGADFRTNPKINGTVDQRGEETILYIRTDSETAPDIRRTVAHELNHKIQSIENFARGGRPESFLKFANQITEIELTNDFQDYKSKMLSFDRNTLSKEDRVIVKVIQDYLKNEKNSKDYFYDKYLSLQGEIDSRAVELAIRLKDAYGRQQNLSYSSLIQALAKDEKNPNIIDQAIDIFYEDTSNSQQPVTEPFATFNGFNTYTEAVKNTPINEIIKIDIEGINVGQVTNNGDINDLIRQDIIADQRELSPNGDIVFITKGNSLAKKLVNAEIAREIVKGRVNEEGNIIAREKVELTEVSEDFNKNKKEFGQETAITILGTKILKENTPAFGNNRIVDYSIEIPSDNVLMTKLKNLLQELGVKTMSLETWAENYKKRTGTEPTPNSLADISNKIIAFANGEITQDRLAEETMHFVLEALPQEEIQPLLDMIHKTDEWKEYAQQYTEIYKDDAVVRKEILGKVLKNRIQGKAEQSTLQGQSITRRLAELINRFFEQVRGLFKPQHQQQLDKFTEEIYQKLMAEELYSELSPEQFDGNKMVMYQTGTSPLYNSLTKAVDTFKGLDKITGNNFQYQLNDLELKEFDNLNQLKTASGLATTIRNHIAHLDKRGKQKGFLSTEETLVYQTIEKELQPALGMVSAVLRKEDMGTNTVLQKRVLAEIEDTNNQVERLISDLKIEKQERFKELAEQAAREAGLTDNMKDILIKEMETLDRDTNQFYSLFGGLAHAQNPILNILSTVMSGVNRESNLQFTKRQNELLNIANGLGFKDEQVAQILKKFKDEYYFLSPYDFSTLFLEEAKIKAEIYKGISGVEVAPEELAKIEEEFKIKLTQDQLKDYLYQTTEAIRKSGLYIDVLKKEERKKIEDLTEDFSPKTKNLLNQLSARKRKVFKRAQDNGGLSSEDNYELQQIMYDQQKLSSPYDENGDLFEGLALNDENDVDLAGGVSKESLSDEVRTAYELNHYNQKRREDFADGETKAPMRFIEEVQKIREEQGIDKAIEFLKLNSRISYNSNFWNTFDKAGGITEKLKDNDQTELAEEIARQRIKLKSILKQHRMYNNPSQINFEEMGGTAISEVKDIVTALNGLYKEAKLVLPEDVEEFTESLSETVVNEAYKKQVDDLGLDTLDKQLDFIYQHVTSLDKESLQRSIVNYKRYKNGDINNLPKAFTKYDSKSADENIREYAESKLLPYFKELRPQDLDIQEFVNDIATVQTEEGFNRVVEEAKYVSISPAYIWLDAETSDRLNPEYTKRREANEPLVNLEYKGGMLKNKKYQEYFGVTNGVATKNEKELALLQEVIKFQESTIDAAGMEGKHNKYQLPQFRRQNMARIAQVAGDFSAKNLKESIKDAITVREDDPILGQTIDGQDAKNFQRGALAVPRMGFRKLESAEEVTDEVLYSVMLMAKEAEKRKQRIGALLDIESIRTELQGKQYGDKSGESTTTYKMFDDFVRYNIYGQVENFKWETDFFGLSSKKRNLAPVIRQFQNWVRLVNLGFSVLTPMTSLLQGTTNFMVEKFVGDRIDKDAARQARKKVPKLITEASSEFLNVRAKGELNLMLQYFGLESPMERYMNSNYGKALRGTAIDKSAYFTHYMGDLPLTAQTVMTVLHDFKNVNGELINYSEWRNRNRSLVEKDARALWAKEEKTAYGYLETKDGQMEMNDRFFSEVKNAKERLNFLKNRIQTAKQEIDNQIPQEEKGQIQRHVIFSFFSLHRGFLISSLAKRTKSRHLNLYTGQQEEGSYLGVFNFLGGMIKDARKKGLKQAWREQYKEYDGGYKKVEKNGKFYILKVDGEKETEVGTYDSEAKRNEVYGDVTNQSKRMRQISLKRGFADVVVVNTLAFIALLLKNVADDDDDDYGLEMLSYMNYRLATEVAGQSVGLPAQVYQFLESPTVGLSTIQNSMDIFDLTNDEMVTQGSYRGYSKQQAWVFKSLPLMKEYNKVHNIDRTRNSYEHFNSVYLENFTFAGAMMDDGK